MAIGLTSGVQESIQYDGTNGQYICEEWLVDSTYEGEQNGVLSVGWGGYEREPVPTGNWVFRDWKGRRFTGHMTDSDYQGRGFFTLPTTP